MAASVDLARTVLVIEDSADDVDLMQKVIRKAGLEHLCRFVYDGAEAIAYMKGDEPFTHRRAYPFPDIVLLDLSLPKIDGFGVLEWMRTTPECKDVKVIVCSGWEYGSYFERARRAGACMILKKEFIGEGLKELFGIIGSMVRQREAYECE